eukprot:TRINITY_DN23295_c0_g1_i1.p1 TRINITY_DN23295_c0_g1~~TRINITY_DN23295_c0_g1_i1.p1  ORF type:complete len:363 (-),score=-26.05 TRINITY_DN23295_c0_g1_i1:263-1351(-)
MQPKPYRSKKRCTVCNQVVSKFLVTILQFQNMNSFIYTEQIRNTNQPNNTVNWWCCVVLLRLWAQKKQLFSLNISLLKLKSSFSTSIEKNRKVAARNLEKIDSQKLNLSQIPSCQFIHNQNQTNNAIHIAQCTKQFQTKNKILFAAITMITLQQCNKCKSQCQKYNFFLLFIILFIQYMQNNTSISRMYSRVQQTCASYFLKKQPGSFMITTLWEKKKNNRFLITKSATTKFFGKLGYNENNTKYEKLKRNIKIQNTSLFGKMKNLRETSKYKIHLYLEKDIIRSPHNTKLIKKYSFFGLYTESTQYKINQKVQFSRDHQNSLLIHHYSNKKNVTLLTSSTSSQSSSTQNVMFNHSCLMRNS